MKYKALALLPIAGIAFGAATMAVAGELDTVIKLAFVIRKEQIAPVLVSGHNEAYSATLALSGNNRVQEQWQAQSVAGTNSHYHVDDSAVGATWRVVSPNTIRATWRLLTLYQDRYRARVWQIVQRRLRDQFASRPNRVSGEKAAVQFRPLRSPL